MGAANSKRNKYRKRKKEDVDESLYRDLERLRSLSKTRLNRLSADIENMTSSDNQPHEYKMCESVEQNNTPTSNVSSQHNIKYTHSVHSVNLDDHPVLTKLQNKQNARLENMEQRMDRIRNSAMQAAEQRKFAYMFKAKTEDEQRTELLKEATYALKELKRHQKNSLDEDEGLQEGADGDIIPVKILHGEIRSKDKKIINQDIHEQDKNLLIGGLKLNDPITWLLLPLLLPIVLIVYLMRGIMTNNTNNQISRKKS